MWQTQSNSLTELPNRQFLSKDQDGVVIAMLLLVVFIIQAVTWSDALVVTVNSLVVVVLTKRKNESAWTMLNEREKEIIECLLREWTRGDMSLYGGLSYQDVFDLMKKLGVDTTEAEAEMESRSTEFRRIAGQLGHLNLADTADEVREIVEQCRKEVYGENV